MCDMLKTSSPWLDQRRAHSEKNIHFWSEDSKNYDRNGPEGQFMTASTTMCNAGSPPYGAVFMISAQSIKKWQRAAKWPERWVKN